MNVFGNVHDACAKIYVPVYGNVVFENVRTEYS